jgi:hypothetical protein
MLELIKGNGMEGSDVIVRGGPAFKSSEEPGFVRIMENGTLKVNAYSGTEEDFRFGVFVPILTGISVVEDKSFIKKHDGDWITIQILLNYTGTPVVIRTIGTLVRVYGMRLGLSPTSSKTEMGSVIQFNSDNSIKEAFPDLGRFISPTGPAEYTNVDAYPSSTVHTLVSGDSLLFRLDIRASGFYTSLF